MQAILVGAEDRSVDLELDHRLEFFDCGNLAGEIGILELGLSDIIGKFDDLEWFALLVKNGIVGSQDPDFTSALADALELARFVLTRGSASARTLRIPFL